MAAQSEVRTTSRLAQLQVRFQQKQQQQREMKKLEMSTIIGDTLSNNAKNNNASVDKNLNLTGGTGGKVRQMFDERRRTTGFDRSYPLKPIAATNATGSITARSVGSNFTAQRQQANAIRQANLRRNTINNNSKNQINNNTSDKVDSKPMNWNTTQIKKEPKELISHLQSDTDLNLAFNKLTNLTLKEGGDAGLLQDNLNLNNSAKSSTRIKLNPLLVKKLSPPRIVAKSNSINGPNANNKLHKLRPGGHSTTEPHATVQRKVPSRMTTPSSISKAKNRIITPPAGMVACKICHRHFNEERIAKHEQVCQKMATKKRKIFDATQHRVKGTDAEKYIQKSTHGSGGGGGGGGGGGAGVKASITISAKTSTMPTAKKTNWRRQHEEFISAIRAAKQVQIHLAKGGKLSDLPPPPPSENPDYIQCPHCQRRFNEAAATRHIPKCATMLHNKRKPAPKKK